NADMGTDTLFAHRKQSGSKLPHSKRFASANAHCIRGSALETIGISAPFLATESQQVFRSPGWLTV
ncbi:MAG: hypothetical protein QHJ82_14215, partial [Verrucomicrobiota bacterium]|nr:hypothetical protein [Verrucomicrobiota bacterium]